MIEKVLFKIVNEEVRFVRNDGTVPLFTENYNGELQVGIVKIHFSEDCFEKVLDIASTELLTNNPLYQAFDFNYVKLPDELVSNLGSLLTNIHFNRKEYEIRNVTPLGSENVYTYEPKQIDFKDCDFVNKFQCKLILRDIYTNVVFKPCFFMVEVIFTNDSVSYIDEQI